MRFLRLLAVSLMLCVPAITLGALNARAQGGGGGGRGGATAAKPLTLTVEGFADGTDIPAKYTQAGDQTSPKISWINTPAGTVTFVLNVHDIDNSHNHTTDDQAHWVVWNIPGSATGLPEGVPKGEKLENGAYQTSANGASYRGPGAPANGPKHHYVFDLYALDTTLDVQPGTDGFATRTEVMKAMQGHIIGKAAYVGLFRRPE